MKMRQDDADLATRRRNLTAPPSVLCLW